MWWYGEGLLENWRLVSHAMEWLLDTFSLSTLLRTLFSPWKNDVLSARNIALSDQVKLWEQNFASRIIGFIIRLIVIVVAVVLLVVALVAAIVALAIWFVLPVLYLTLPILAAFIALKQ